MLRVADDKVRRVELQGKTGEAVALAGVEGVSGALGRKERGPGMGRLLYGWKRGQGTRRTGRAKAGSGGGLPGTP